MSEFDPRNLTHVPSPAEIDAGRSERGGFTRERLAGWGVPWPPPSGWRRGLNAEHARRLQVAAMGGDDRTSESWPCVVVKGGEIRIIGTALLHDGRYRLIRD